VSPSTRADADHLVPGNVRPAGALLRLATAGSVDDGKSTLVGRLLYDSKSIFTDQLDAVTRTSHDRGLLEADLALLTDGLRAEREQGITIDVAYRYFATPRRRFILADTPGHVQYTRNMVTGASTAELAVVLVDARNGVVEQTRRHTAVAALLRVPQVVLAVNKMDLVDYSESVFAAIAAEFSAYARSLGIHRVTAIPLSALCGDNVVEPSAHMDWYAGQPLLAHLEDVEIADDTATAPARFPVQYVIDGPGDGYRAYAGQLASGSLAVGDRIAVWPTGRHTHIAAIDRYQDSVNQGHAGQALSLRLVDDLDVARGDLITLAHDAPMLTRELTATACHLADRPLRVGDQVLVKHTSRTTRGQVRAIPDRLDITDLSRHPQPGLLNANDIGTVVVRTEEPLVLDAYATNRTTGSCLLIDPTDGTTLSAAMAGAPFTDARS